MAKWKPNKYTKYLAHDVLIIYSPKYGDIKVIIDKEDIDLLKNYKWHAHFDPKLNGFYIQTNVKSNGKHTMPKLHRFIMCAKNGEVVDHINGNTLDNRKENLRTCTQAVNTRNSKRKNNKSTGIANIYKNKQKKKYESFFVYEKITHRVGSFETISEAKKELNAKRIEVLLECR